MLIWTLHSEAHRGLSVTNRYQQLQPVLIYFSHNFSEYILRNMSFKPDILAIPLKRSSDVDILKPLKNLISSRYQSCDQESYVSAINEFAKLRSQAAGRALDYHESSLETIYRYV